MKKILSLAIACLLLLPAAAVFASAESALPFDLVAPAYVSAEWLGGNDSPTTTAIAYSLSNEMTSFFKRLEDAVADGTSAQLLSQYGCDDIGITTQVDWAVDDVGDAVSGWHANEFWKADYGFGYDGEYRYRVGEWDGVDMWIGNWTETLNSHWVTRHVGESELNGNPESKTPGLKDQMKPDQYEYKYVDGEGSLWIDYTKHTVYFRMRFVVTTSKDTDDGTKSQYYYSDWSNIASVGKDAEKFVPLTKADLPAPVVTGLRMTDKEFNGNPVVAFTLTVPEELSANAAKITAAGGYIYIETYCRVKGDADWTEMGNVDRSIKAGEMECALLSLVSDERPNIPKDAQIELRCRYYCSQPGREDLLWSDYSETVSFGADGINAGKTDLTTGTASEDTSECPICHFCPQPLGFCIFIWLLILLVVIVVVVVLILVGKKKKKDR